MLNRLKLDRKSTMKRVLVGVFTWILTVTTFGLTPVSVQSGSIGETATNPLGNLIQFQMIDQFNFENYEVDSPSNDFIMQPVIPFKLPFERVPTLLTRTSVPIVTTPDFGAPIDRHTSLGDTVLNMFFLIDLGIEGVDFALGPTITFPTAGLDVTGAGKWQAGPTLLYVNLQIPKVQYGILAYQQWSFAGESDRTDVSKLYLQPFITKHFEEGWYLGTQDIPWSYNFETDNWTMPMGPKLGRVFNIGRQPVNAFGAVYYSPLNDGASPEWTARFGLTLLFPEG